MDEASEDLMSEVEAGKLSAHAVLEKLAWALRSESGPMRPSNEDYAGFYAPTTPDDAWEHGPLFLVADGLGGHAAGEVASRLAVETVLANWTEAAGAAPRQALRAAVRGANTAVFDAALAPGRRGMATTLTALTLFGREALIAHVGDSRAYVVRGDQCTQLTEDHSRVGEMLRMRLITPEQAAHHPGRSQLTRTVGSEPAVQVDLITERLETGDVFVLCSDGLWDLVSRAEIVQVCSAIGTGSMPTPAAAADALIDLSLKRQAPDNITVVVVRVTSPLPIRPAPGRRSLFRRRRT